MTVRELTREELQELKIHMLDEFLQEEENRNISYGEMADIDELVTDESVFKEYENTSFVKDDFFCNVD